MAPISTIFPMGSAWDRAVDDASTVPHDAVSIRLVARAKNFDKLPTYPNLAHLWCFDIDAHALDTICSCPALQSLYIENIKTGDLGSLKRLTKLNVLGLERCSKITSLGDIGRLASLQALGITHFKNVHDLGPLSQLGGLRALGVAGSMWATMRVESFGPLAELRALEFLHLTNIKPEDRSLHPLAHLTNLKKLEIANLHPTAEFAWLARRLSSTECQWFEPYVSIPSIRCTKCGTATLMLTGKGASTICSECDGSRLQKHLREWAESYN